jgi:hypothetical protein
MRRKTWLETAFVALALAAPAAAQTIEGILVEPAHPTTRDPIEITVAGTEFPSCPPAWKLEADPAGGGVFVLSALLPPCPHPIDPPVSFRETLTLPPQPVGNYLIQVANLAPWNAIFEVREPDPSLELGQGKFVVTVEWSHPHDGSHGAGYARRFAEDSGAFWYFHSNNLETTIKILDGRPVNGRWWVFIANMTDLEVEVTVLYNRNDCLSLPVFPPDCPTKTYVQTAGQSRNFIDVNAFED